MNWVPAILQPYALAILRWLAIAGAVLLVLLGVKNAGRKAEQLENIKRTLKVKDAQQDAAARSPHTRNDLIDRLRDGEF